MSLIDKFRKPSREDFGDYELNKLRKEYKNENIEVFASSLKYLVDLDIYNNLFEVYSNWEEPVPLLSDETAEIANESSLLVLAYENLSRSPKLFSELIDYPKFYYLYPFIEWVYSMYLGRRLISEDVKRIFKSDIGERIVFNLEDFDKVEIISEPTPEFFQKLRKLKWKDIKTKKFHSKLEKVLRFFVFENFGFKEGAFIAKQMEIILFLAGCSAVNEGKEKIDENDVIRAYMALFKIIETDISKLIDKREK